MQSSSETLPAVGIITLGIASYLNPLLQLAGILQKRGYRVIFLSTNALVGGTAAANGYDFYHLDATADAACIANARAGLRVDWLPEGMREDRIKALATQTWLQKTGYGLPAFLQQHRPCCVLVMAELHEAIVFLAGQGTPLVVVDTHLASRRRPGIPPPHRAYLPRSGVANRVHCALDWWLHKQRRRLSRARQRLRLGRAARFSALRQMASELKLDTHHFLDMNQWHFVDYPQLPLLRLANPMLDFSPDPEPGVFYTGALAHSGAAAAGPLAATTDAWRNVVASTGQSGRALVYCSLGSFMSNKAFLGRVIRASTGKPWNLLIATGPDCKPADLGELPDNVSAFQWLPQWDVLDHASAMLCAAGNATINECIFKGVPMLVYPIDRMDQLGMAARVEFHGIGLRGKQNDEPNSIADKLTTVLASDTIRAKIGTMHRHYNDVAASGKAEAAVRDALQSAGADR